MPKVKNIESVASLTQKVGKSNAVILTDYRGLTHKQLEELHKVLRKVEADFVVVKNTLLKIAAKDKYTLESTGPTAALFAYGDGLSALKELSKFVKTYSLPKIKMGILDGIVYDETAVGRIAALPSKEGLIAQLMYTLNANTQKLAYLLIQIHSNKGGENNV